MSKVRVEHEGKVYELTYTKRTVSNLEAQGFDANKIDINPVTMIPLFYRAAFDAKHPMLSKSTRDAVWYAQRNKQGLLGALVDIYTSVVMSLMDEPDGDDEGNATWEVLE